MKTKNVPYGLKCKINTNFFCKQDFPKGGGGGGPAIWEKFPKNVDFFLTSPLKSIIQERENLLGGTWAKYLKSEVNGIYSG